jgi:hypothetical protein
MNWISVNERLPELGKEVLICEGDWQAISMLADTTSWDRQEDYSMGKPYPQNIIWYSLPGARPTHWMELPPKPSEASKIVKNLSDSSWPADNGLLRKELNKIGKE